MVIYFGSGGGVHVSDRLMHVVRLTPTPAAYTCFELSAKIDLSFPFGVAVNSLLSIT